MLFIELCRCQTFSGGRDISAGDTGTYQVFAAARFRMVRPGANDWMARSVPTVQGANPAGQPARSMFAKHHGHI